MRHLKEEFDKLTFKELFLYGMSAACMASGIAAVFLGMYLPPKGEVHASILTYFGISSAFAGSLLGISAHVSSELMKFRTEVFRVIGQEKDDKKEEKIG